MTRVAIVDSGVANLASITNAFRLLGVEAVIAQDPSALRDATHLVLPGVGAFEAGLAGLRSRGLDTALRQAVQREQPLLAVCLGLQMLCDASDENPGVEGLGILGGTCRRLPGCGLRTGGGSSCACSRRVRARGGWRRRR